MNIIKKLTKNIFGQKIIGFLIFVITKFIFHSIRWNCLSKKNQDIISLMMILGLGYYTYFMIISSISQYYAHKQPPFTKFEKFAHDNGLITFVGFYGLIIKYCCSKH